MSLAAVVKAKREAAGLTQDGLASRAGLSRPAIEHLEGGTRTDPRVSTIVRLSRGLGVEPSELLAPFVRDSQT
jgi:transcriptional regulator with XRE-family HTH domain